MKAKCFTAENSNVNLDKIKLEELNINQKTKKAVKSFFMFLAIALVCVLIPVFHFVLVPLFLITAFVVSYKKYTEIASLEIAEFKCPKCSTPISLKPFYFREYDNSQRVNCPKCNELIYFEINK